MSDTLENLKSHIKQYKTAELSIETEDDMLCLVLTFPTTKFYITDFEYNSVPIFKVKFHQELQKYENLDTNQKPQK